MKPVIGVVPLYDEEKESIWMLPGYLEVLQACGALPFVFPFTENADDVARLVNMVDGILFTGGQDVDPALYGEEPLPECGAPLPARDVLETLLLDEAQARDLPVFGICRAIQFFNVHWGGTLWQDLATQHPTEPLLKHHMSPPYDREAHRVTLVEGSSLQRLLGITELGVNSYHHQGIRELAPMLEPMAHASDGIIEAVRNPAMRFAWAVQWHPELSWRADPHQQTIVQAFVDACA